MDWADNIIILSTTASTERGEIVTGFSSLHGKWSGFVKSKKNIKFDVGDICCASWYSRTADGLGNYVLEHTLSPFQKFYANKDCLFLIKSACELLVNMLADRDPYYNLYCRTEVLLRDISFLQYALWEIDFLKLVGYGLGLSRCAVTGKSNGLYYLSPKTGHAVTKDAGEKYKEKLFVIPEFWLNNIIPDDNDIYNSLLITGFFIERIMKKPLLFRRMLLDFVLQRAA